jgi:hypothetical protein
MLSNIDTFPMHQIVLKSMQRLSNCSMRADGHSDFSNRCLPELGDCILFQLIYTLKLEAIYSSETSDFRKNI